MDEIIPRDDNPGPDLNLDTPTGNDLEDYYKELEKRDKQNEELDKIDKKNKELDLELKPLSFSFREFKKPSSVVLENVGNTTYMSCVLHCLANIQSIAKYYLKEINEIKNHLNEIPLSYVFSRVIFHLYSCPQGSLQQSFSLSNFHKYTISVNRFLDGNSTKSAVDFLYFLLDILHDEDKQIHKNNNINNTSEETKSETYKDSKEYIEYLKKTEKSIIFNDFGWANQKIKKCEQCKFESIVYQEFFTFDLFLEYSLQNFKLNEISVFECIKRQYQKRQLYNIHCKVCKNKTQFESESLILFTPKYFIFILNEDKMKELINKNIKFIIDPSFNLNDAIKDYTMDNNYELIGMIVYELFLNNNIEYKEYNAYYMSFFDNNWYKYEKDKISEVNIKQLLKSNFLKPVILFYRINEKENKKEKENK